MRCRVHRKFGTIETLVNPVRIQRGRVRLSMVVVAGAGLGLGTSRRLSSQDLPHVATGGGLRRFLK